ncbi:Ribosome biogenesis protein BRX1 [Seminavis robusta]|uniref:Ribosome biogenesis protein BRX1 n=1 Tax=Seminavis robusta TaxID=568900 RepID=A0A9N8DLA3_9STRA|nr:Ribosome biogenesis protein BRX1 [Seminavis robusta]|eukprot:Sro144_g066850.1 Ribosome biogenesis protein BRX1 (340) ;mRNA; r:7855-9128
MMGKNKKKDKQVKSKRPKAETEETEEEDVPSQEEAMKNEEPEEEEQADEGAVSSEEEEEEEEPESPPVVPSFISDGKYRNKQRCLISCSRGITARFRHLLEDLRTCIPHHKKEAKLDPGPDGIGRAMTDIAAMRECNSVLFLECRKRQDAYLWMGKTGTGPSVKFHVSNIHTMDELKLTGNCMRGSRPVLSFDESFTRLGHLKLLRELFVDIFGTPRGHPKAKPFVDRVMAFYYADKKIWVRNYQITEPDPQQLKQDDKGSLVEIGPRFVLNPVCIFHGSFGGQSLFRNSAFVSPNNSRAEMRKLKGQSYVARKEAQKKHKQRQEEMVLPEDPLDSVFR